MNIYEKMLAITSELTKVAKNLEVGFGANKYKAVGEADILATVRPLEVKYKIYSFPINRKVIETGELETKNGGKNLFLRIETTYRFVNVEKPEEFIEITSYGDGVDPQDKSVGKAMTYADKYALMKAYKIMTGDDPDQFASEELSKKTKKYARNTANTEVLPQNGVIIDKKEGNTQNGSKMGENTKNTILGLPDNLKAFACKKYGLNNIEELSQENAVYIINSLQSKGLL